MMLSFPINSPISWVDIYNQDHTIRLLHLNPAPDSLPYRKSVSMPHETWQQRRVLEQGHRNWPTA